MTTRTFNEVGLEAPSDSKLNKLVVPEKALTALDRRKQTLVERANDARKQKKRNLANRILKRNFELDTLDQDSAARLMRSFRKDERLERIRELMSDHGPHFKAPFVAARSWLDFELLDGNIEAASTICDSLSRSEHPLDRAYAESRRYRIDLEIRATALGLNENERPRLGWMESPYPGNFGDILNPYIVEKLTGMPPVRVPLGVANLVIGSVIKFARPGTHVWGSGTPRMTDKLEPKALYHSVRGPRTRQLVLSSGGDCPPIYGDVAVMLPSIYFPKVEKTHRVGLIRHTAHRRRPISLSGVKEIEITCVGDAGIENFVREVLSCEKIISTSLHGIIVAHAYGIQAEWGWFSDAGEEVEQVRIKFTDYMESVGLKDHAPLNLSSFSTLEESKLFPLISRIPETPIDIVQLAAASPFKLLRANDGHKDYP